MGENSKIEWTDATWNPTVGCSVVSAGCKRCYAMREAARLARMGGKVGEKYAGLTTETNAGPVWNGTVRLHEASLDQALRWKRPRRVFVNSMSDLFHEALSHHDQDKVLAAMIEAPQHVYQILTKRSERALAYFLDLPRRRRELGCHSGLDWTDFPLGNILLGCTVENQAAADERREAMRRLAELGWRVWVSYEPALGPVDWRGWEFLSWLVCGGESGPNARPMHPAWARSARDWSQAAGVPFLFKQWGEWGPAGHRVGKAKAGRLLDGREHLAMPS